MDSIHETELNLRLLGDIREGDTIACDDGGELSIIRAPRNTVEWIVSRSRRVDGSLVRMKLNFIMKDAEYHAPEDVIVSALPDTIRGLGMLRLVYAKDAMMACVVCDLLARCEKLLFC